MKAIIRSANRNTTLSKEFPESAYTVEPVREKKINILSLFLEELRGCFYIVTFRAIAVPAKSEGGRSGTILAT